MTLTASRVVDHRRPIPVWVTAILLFFLGVTAVVGGVALVTGVIEAMSPPIEWLQPIPLIDSWVVPGLVLGIGFGVGSLVTGFGVMTRPGWPWVEWVEARTRHHWSWLATILVGVAHVLWIGLELVFLPELSILQVVYGPLGLALVVLPLTASVSSYLRID